MNPITEKSWRLCDQNNAQIERLALQCGIDTVLARLLLNRGIDNAEDVKAFLDPKLSALLNPMLMLDMDRAVARISEAVCAGELIAVFGDYDADGVTSTALLVDFFRTIGANVTYYIPQRLSEGYGLSAGALDGVLALHPRVIITVDCGISSVKEAALCKKAGVDLVVTDHHTPGEVLPDAYAVINPLRKGCQYSFKKLAGVGVAYNLAIALRVKLRADGYFSSRPEPDLKRFLDLVTVGTVADVVPLVGQNRILVKRGLVELTETKRAGIEALKRISGINGVVSSSDVGFRIGPRINATGRLADSSLSVELLLAEDYTRANAIADELDSSNGERQSIGKEILDSVVEMIRSMPHLSERNAIVLASDQWHVGVVGIIASKVVEMFHKPAVLISLQESGYGKASGRSIPGVHLYDALNMCSEHLVKFGGHAQAAGLTIEIDKIDTFITAFDDAVSGMIDDSNRLPVIEIDAELTPADLTFQLVERVGRLEPFGAGNPEPLFLLRGCSVVGKRILKETHLKLNLKAGNMVFESIGFGMALLKMVDVGDVIDATFTVCINRFNGKEALQLRLKDFKSNFAEECRLVVHD